MPANYTGDPSGETDELPTIACPVDGDARNAVSVNNPLQKIADVLAFLINRTHPNVLADGQTRVLISEADDNRGTSNPKTRIYLNLYGEIEIARNCHWEPLDGEWLADIWYPSRTKGCSSLLLLGVDGPQLRTYGSAVSDPTINGWEDSAWFIHAALGESGFLKFFDVIDPYETEAQANVLRAKNTPKAWGTILVSSGVASVEDGFNIASVSQAAGTLTVNFAAGFANANYAAFATSMGALTAPSWGVLARRVGGCDLILPSGDLTTGTHRVSLLVFGRQDT